MESFATLRQHLPEKLDLLGEAWVARFDRSHHG
jgi:hypothetical protein